MEDLEEEALLREQEEFFGKKETAAATVLRAAPPLVRSHKETHARTDNAERRNAIAPKPVAQTDVVVSEVVEREVLPFVAPFPAPGSILGAAVSVTNYVPRSRRIKKEVSADEGMKSQINTPAGRKKAVIERRTADEEMGNKKPIAAKENRITEQRHVKFAPPLDAKTSVHETYATGDEFPAWIPKDRLEMDKLGWMMSNYDEKVPVTASNNLRTDPLTSNDELQPKKGRYTFDGELIDPKAMVPTYLGLHHHGENPDDPGYTVEELLHLCRSTVPGQRALAMSVLARIWERQVGSNSISLPTAEPALRSRESAELRENVDKFVLCFRIGLDDPHMTIVSAAMAGLETILESGDSVDVLAQEGLRDLMFFSPSGERMFWYNRAQEDVFNRMAAGLPKQRRVDDDEADDDDEVEKNVSGAGFDDMDIEKIQRVLKMDKIRGLSMTRLVSRLGYILDKSYAPALKLSAIRLLILFFRHSPRISKKTLAALEPFWGSLVSLARTHSSKTRAGDDSSEIGMQMALKVVRLACQIDKNVANEVIRLPDFVGTLDNALVPECLPDALLLRELLMILTISCCYEQKSDIIDINNFLVKALERLRSTRLALDRNITTNAILKLALTYITVSADDSGALGGISYKKGRAILSQIQSTTAEEDPVVKLVRYQLQTWLIYIGIRTGMNIDDGVLSGTPFPATLGNKVDLATLWKLSVLSAQYDVHAARLRFCRLKRGEFDSEERSIVERSQEHFAQWSQRRFHMAHFLPGLKRYLLEVISTPLLVRGRSSDVALFSLQALMIMGPGDEVRAIETMQLLLRAISIPDLQGIEPLTQQELSDVYRAFLFGARTVRRSKSFNRIDPLERLSDVVTKNTEKVEPLLTLSIEPTTSGGLPLEDTWELLPIESQVDAEEEGYYEATVRLVYIALTLHIQLSTLLGDRAVYGRDGAWGTFMVLMKVFLLPSDTRGEIFHHDVVRKLMDQAFVLFCKPDRKFVESNDNGALSLPAMDDVGDLGGRFYTLYTQLVEQFGSVSFGDPVFARYLFIPLPMTFPSDYRRVFWGNLAEILQIVQTDFSELAFVRSVKPFLFPAETDIEVLCLYASALGCGRISPGSSSLLWGIAVHHLSAYLTVHMSNSSDKADMKRVVHAVVSGASKDHERIDRALQWISCFVTKDMIRKKKWWYLRNEDCAESTNRFRILEDLLAQQLSSRTNKS
ncbi:hypothetical protein BJ742DRAFT_219235 [Cladochytrium replicatum]|nr:hypothetical protein BJ742DRAFT_219235 [Cladochytrium replicatum]